MDQMIKRRCLAHVSRSRILRLRHSSTIATTRYNPFQSTPTVPPSTQQPKPRPQPQPPSPPSTAATPKAATETPTSQPQQPVETTPPPKPSDLHHYTLSTPPTPAQLAYTSTFFSNPLSPPILLWTEQRFHAIPRSPYPEICFVGRSNVGKSSLLNALFNRPRSNTARVSSKPGHTRTLNAFGVGGNQRDPRAKAPLKSLGAGSLVVVDTPGYGKGSRNEWGAEIDKFFLKRTQLRKVFVLVDAEHGLKSTDLELLGHFERNSVPYQILLSKVDKIIDVDNNKIPSVGKLNRGVEKLKLKIKEVEKKLEELVPEGGRKMQRDVLCVSAEKGVLGHGWPRGRMGVDAVRWAALRACGLECDENGQKQVMEEMNVVWEDDE